MFLDRLETVGKVKIRSRSRVTVKQPTWPSSRPSQRVLLIRFWIFSSQSVMPMPEKPISRPPKGSPAASPGAWPPSTPMVPGSTKFPTTKH